MYRYYTFGGVAHPPNNEQDAMAIAKLPWPGPRDISNCPTIAVVRKSAYGQASRNRAEWVSPVVTRLSLRQRHPGLEPKGRLMPIYLCRWSDRDVSLTAGEFEVEVADVLDEVDNPDAAELMQLEHAIAFHFKLGTRPGEEGTLPLRFEDMSEQVESSIYERAYPVFNEVCTKPDPTVQELTETLKHEKNPIYRRTPEPSSNPSVAGLQDELQMPRVVLEHLAGRAAATAGIRGEMATEDVRKLVCNPVYCLDRVAPWIAEPP